MEAKKPCNFFMQTGKCKYGNQCKFSHDVGMGGPQPQLGFQSEMGSSGHSYNPHSGGRFHGPPGGRSRPIYDNMGPRPPFKEKSPFCIAYQKGECFDLACQ